MRKRRLQLKTRTTVTKKGYGYRFGQVGRRIEYDRFVELYQWYQIDDHRINANLRMRTHDENKD